MALLVLLGSPNRGKYRYTITMTPNRSDGSAEPSKCHFVMLTFSRLINFGAEIVVDNLPVEILLLLGHYPIPAYPHFFSVFLVFSNE